MGIAAASLEGNSCEEQVQFLTLLNESSQEERQRIGVRIGRTTTALLKSKDRSAEDVRRELAKFVKTLIRKPASSKAKRRRKS